MAKCAFDGAMCHIVSVATAFDSGGETHNIHGVSLEYDMIENVFELINSKNTPVFIGHNIINFDLRILKQRAMILGIKLPSALKRDFKPWGSDAYDTMLRWDAKNYTSLDKLAKAFGVKGKGDIDGSMVWDMWKAGKYDEIVEYNAQDVKIVREIYNKMEK